MGAQPQERNTDVDRTAASADLCGAARRREVQSSGSPLGEEGSGRPCQEDWSQEERDPGEDVGERHGVSPFKP